jgi:excisionase family DNA binding protein
MNKAEDVPLAYRVADFCRRIGISRSTFYTLLKQKKIHVIRIGGRTLVSRAEAERLASGGAR